MSFGIAKEDDRASSNGWRRCKEEEDRLSISPVKTSLVGRVARLVVYQPKGLQGPFACSGLQLTEAYLPTRSVSSLTPDLIPAITLKSWSPKLLSQSVASERRTPPPCNIGSRSVYAREPSYHHGMPMTGQSSIVTDTARGKKTLAVPDATHEPVPLRSGSSKGLHSFVSRCAPKTTHHHAIVNLSLEP
jgi:hypothetical protein